jgi:hypothetical protein
MVRKIVPYWLLMVNNKSARTVSQVGRLSRLVFRAPLMWRIIVQGCVKVNANGYLGQATGDWKHD